MSDIFDEHHHQHDEHHKEHHHDEHQHEEPVSSSEPHEHHENNGYVVVPPTPQSSVDSGSNGNANVEKVLDLLTGDAPKDLQEDITRALADIGHAASERLERTVETVRAEADSSSASQRKKTPTAPPASEAKACSPNSTFLCPFYNMAVDRLNKVQIPPRVKDMLLWKNPKLTGAVFGSALVLLISMMCFSLLTIVSALLLTAMTIVGTYRFYLALLFRIKGTYDNTFDKYSAQDVSLPKDKVQQIANLLETDFNRTLNKAKSIVLWDNITTSGIAFFGFYIVYCVGCWFNTITLLILALVSAFTLPKVYEVYKEPIDQAIEKATTLIHQTVKQISAKIPMLNKKKAQ